MNSLKPFFFLVSFLLSVWHNEATAVDKEVTLFSKTLQEYRKIQLYTPAGYTLSKSYPVVYVLDGDGHFEHLVNVTKFLVQAGQIPPVIVVGIKNVNRTKDFTPVHSLAGIDGKTDSIRFATTGGGIKFLRFLEEEVIPFVDQNYKTLPYRVLSGHSLGGLFSLYALEHSTAFRSFLIISPAFIGANKSVLASVPEFLTKNKNTTDAVYISIGNEARLQQGVDTLVNYFNQYSKEIRWEYEMFKNETHSSVPYLSWYAGLKLVYRDWQINYTESGQYKTYEDIEDYFIKLSQKKGCTIPSTEEVVLSFGLEQLYNRRDPEGAIYTFEQNVKRHPDSANAYESLAESYRVKGNKKLAIKNYEQALKLNPDFERARQRLLELKADN